MTPAASCPPPAPRTPEYRTQDAARARTKRRLIAYGRWNLWTDAEPVRNHIATLAIHNIGWKHAAALAGLHKSTVDHWLHGHCGSPPPARIKTELAARLLAVRPILDNVADSTLIDATGAVRRLQALVAAGFPAKYLAIRLGMNTSDTHRMMRRSMMRAATARAVYALFGELQNANPADHDVDAAASTRARNVARRNGWLALSQWDGEIDNVDADPRTWVRSGNGRHRIEDIVADAEELHAEHGLSWEAAAAQVGVLVNTLHTYRSRVRERAAATAAS